MARSAKPDSVRASPQFSGLSRGRPKSPSSSAAARPRSRARTPSAAPTTRDNKSPAVAVEDVHTKYEFGGPLGAVGVIVGLPLVTYALYFLCNSETCVTDPLMFDYPTALRRILDLDGLVSLHAVYIFVGWMAFHVILDRLLPGEVAEGAPLPRGGARLSYCLSGHLQFWLTLIIILIGVPTFIPSGSQGL